jgi:hypothetical protein
MNTYFCDDCDEFVDADDAIPQLLGPPICAMCGNDLEEAESLEDNFNEQGEPSATD